MVGEIFLRGYLLLGFHFWPIVRAERIAMWPNKALHATATVLSDFVTARKHNTVVAVASALPVAVRELGR